MYFTTRAFWADLTERVVSTAAAGAIAVVTAASFDLVEVDSWQAVGAAAGVAGLMSFLKAFALGRGEPVPDPDPTPAPVAQASSVTPATVTTGGGVTSTFPPAGS